MFFWVFKHNQSNYFDQNLTLKGMVKVWVFFSPLLEQYVVFLSIRETEKQTERIELPLGMGVCSIKTEF